MVTGSRTPCRTGLRAEEDITFYLYSKALSYKQLPIISFCCVASRFLLFGFWVCRFLPFWSFFVVACLVFRLLPVFPEPTLRIPRMLLFFRLLNFAYLLCGYYRCCDVWDSRWMFFWTFLDVFLLFCFFGFFKRTDAVPSITKASSCTSSSDARNLFEHVRVLERLARLV